MRWRGRSRRLWLSSVVSTEYDIADVDTGAEQQPQCVFLINFEDESHVGDLDAALRKRQDVVVDRITDELDAFRYYRR